MTLATIVANPPSRNEKYRCTLIVCSPSLLGQCMYFARSRDEHLLNILRGA